MKLEKVIADQFAELEILMTQVAATKTATDMGDGLDDGLFHEWSNSVLSLLDRSFGKDSTHFRNFESGYKNFRGWYHESVPLMGIFKSAKFAFEKGYLFKVESIVSAELIDDVLDQTQHLLDSQYKDPACVIAGVALESTLKKLCDRSSISRNNLDRMNADLAKASVYNVGMQKQITAWADRRNKAAHGDWSEYNDHDVDDMIKGVRRFMSEYL